MGVQLCGQPLDYAHDVQPLLDRFDALDVDNNATSRTRHRVRRAGAEHHPQLAQQTSPEVNESQRFRLPSPATRRTLPSSRGVERHGSGQNNGASRMLSRHPPASQRARRTA